MDFLGGRPVRTGYHGAEGDARYPSPRRLRNALANIIDGLLIFVVVAAVLVPVLLVWEDAFLDHNLLILGLTVAVLVSVLMVNSVLLPSLIGSTLGQLVTGLIWIRGADASRPGTKEMWSEYFDHRGVVRFGGVHSSAPQIVVVRRRDVAPRPSTPKAVRAEAAGYTEH
ncbi:RDD family protein [Nocardia sp. NPDC058176]|uniref:RDD family protein n=1 Tax=Nocardia sp. NPDC058176 TaxID=3346368 RepID=UPI0036DF353E